MPVLFAFSILAFVALLWATVSIAGVVRRSKRRARRHAADAENALPSIDSAVLTSLKPLVYKEPFATEPLATEPPTSAQPLPPAGRPSEPLPLQTVEPQFIPPPPPPPRLAHREVRQQKTVIAPEAVEAFAPEPFLEPFSVAPPPPPPPPSPELPSPEPPPRLRSFPTRLGRHAVAAIGAEEAPPRWNPFNGDFGDLSDPSPSRRPRNLRPRDPDSGR